MTDERFAETPYSESPDGWWTKYGGAQDPRSGVVYFPPGSQPPPCACRDRREKEKEK